MGVPHPVWARATQLFSSRGPLVPDRVGHQHEESPQHAPQPRAFDARAILIETRDERRRRASRSAYQLRNAASSALLGKPESVSLTGKVSRVFMIASLDHKRCCTDKVIYHASGSFTVDRVASSCQGLERHGWTRRNRTWFSVELSGLGERTWLRARPCRASPRAYRCEQSRSRIPPH